MFSDVVEVFVLAQQDIDARIGHDAIDGRRARAAFVDDDLLWQLMPTDGPFQKAPRCIQNPLGRRTEVNRSACPINVPVLVLPSCVICLVGQDHPLNLGFPRSTVDATHN